MAVEPAAARRVEVTVQGESMAPAQVTVAPGGEVVVMNATAEPRHVKLERLTYASGAATAFQLSTLTEFRRLFSAELVKRGTPLKVSRGAILFTDPTGSTALYSRVGDAAAFRLVDDHFDVLRAAVDRAGGVVVKTMGDAVMAGFPDEEAALAGAAACLEAFEAFRARATPGELTHLKLGLFGGPVYVITANGVLDYFGQTVNMASRLQHLAQPGELVVESRLAAAHPRLAVSPPFLASVKGVHAALELVRYRLR